MADLIFLSLLLVLIAGAAFYGLLWTRQLGRSRERRKRLLVPPPDIAKQLLETEAATRETTTLSKRSPLPPLDVPLSQQRLCLECGTSNLKEAATCRRCGEPLAAAAAITETVAPHAPPAPVAVKGPVYVTLLVLLSVSLLAILHQAIKLYQ